MRRAAVAFAAALVFAAPASAGSASFSFGRAGAHDILYRVTINSSGAVTTRGAVRVRKHTLSAHALAGIRRALAETPFGSLPNIRDCPGTGRSVTWSYVVFGGSVFLQHGNCSTGLIRAWHELADAVGLTVGLAERPLAGAR